MKEEGKQPLVIPKTPQSPIDLWRLMGGKARPVRGAAQSLQDSLLAVYKDRLTYTFILGLEVASIHFDRSKKEIFFKGHNLHNLKLNEHQIKALTDFKQVLKADERGRPFSKDYEATLGDLLADNHNEGIKVNLCPK